jgi:hypothetical protein
LERRLGQHDEKFRAVFDAIRQLMTPPAEPEKKRKIGFARDHWTRPALLWTGSSSTDLDAGVKVNYARFSDLLAESRAITITGANDEE